MGTETATQLPPATPENDRFFYGWRYVTKWRADGTEYTEQVPLTERDVLHPQEGDVLMNNEIHDEANNYLKITLRKWLEDQPGTLVLRDHRIDFQVDDIEAMSPDIVIFRDAPSWHSQQGTFYVRNQGARTTLIIEVTSPSTRRNDLIDKVQLYYLIGATRYVIIDVKVTEEEPNGRILAYVMTSEGPVPQELTDPTRVWLPELNLWLQVTGEEVLLKKQDGTALRNYSEAIDDAEENLAIAEQEKARAEQEKARAEQEKARAEQEKARAEQMQTDRDVALLRIRELEEQLKRRNGSQP